MEEQKPESSDSMTRVTIWLMIIGLVLAASHLAVALCDLLIHI